MENPMSVDPPGNERRLRWAACAVAVAAAVGAAPVTAKAETKAIEQIQRYCSASWRNAGIDQQEWPDCTQQALAELLERVSRPGLGDAIQDAGSPERRELNRTVWRTIQRWRRSPKCLPYFDDGGSCNAAAGPQATATDPWIEVLNEARKCLSDRQQQILKLTRDGWRVGEIAQRLELTPARVSDEKYKAICRLRARLAAPA